MNIQASDLKQKHSLNRFINDLIYMTGISQYLILFISIAIFFRPTHFIIALTVHLRFQYLFLSIITNAYAIAPYYFHTNLSNKVNTGLKDSKSTMRIMMTNVYTQNNLKSELLDQVKVLNPDILVLQEINENWKNELEKLKKNYDFFLHKTREDNFELPY